VPLGFSPIRSGEQAQEVSNVLPMLEYVGAKLLKLEEVVSDQLEPKGHVLTEKVEEHVLMCSWSRDPVISLDPVALRPAVEIEGATRDSIQEAAKIVDMWFQRLAEDA
jgi:hypothetical protein